MFYVIDNSSASSKLKASIEAMKNGIGSAEAQAQETYGKKLSYDVKKTSGDENATDQSGENYYVKKTIKDITDIINANF